MQTFIYVQALKQEDGVIFRHTVITVRSSEVEGGDWQLAAYRAGHRSVLWADNPPNVMNDYVVKVANHGQLSLDPGVTE